MRPVRHGPMRHLITIQTPTATRSATGDEVITWSTYDQVYAAIEPLRGREYHDGRQVQAEVTTRMIIRYRSGVTSKMRVSWDSRLFDIQSVINVEERDRALELMCREVD